MDSLFGDRLYHLRFSQKMTQKRLAAQLGITDKAVSRWENGVSFPSGSMMIKIANLFDVSLDYLIGTDNNSNAGNVASRELDYGELKEEHTSLNGEIGFKNNFLPTQPPTQTGNYLCTWSLQEKTANSLGLSGKGLENMRDALDETTLFGPKNHYHVLDKELRKDVYFLLDDGWDVPYKTAHFWDKPDNRFGSVCPDKEKFRSFGNCPELILKNLVSKVKELGYKGLGLWISPQHAGNDLEKPIDINADREYWTLKASMCEKAGVSYWKIDWGAGSRIPEYRAMMTEVIRKNAPHILIEQTVTRGANEIDEDESSEKALSVHKNFEISDYFRTYDISWPLRDSVTLSRIHQILKNSSEISMKCGCAGIINVEERAFIAAAFGCSMGIMEYTPAIEAAIRWHRIAPPFKVCGYEYNYSAEQTEDSWYFEKDVDGITEYRGKTVKISAPAIMARNTKLPEVEYLHAVKPRIIASQNPITGAYSVASIQRTLDPSAEIEGLTAVTIFPEHIDKPIGIFGRFGSVKMVFKDKPKKAVQVWAQSLLCNYAERIYDFSIGENGAIIIAGNKLRKIGTVSSGGKQGFIPSCLLKVVSY